MCVWWGWGCGGLKERKKVIYKYVCRLLAELHNIPEWKYWDTQVFISHKKAIKISPASVHSDFRTKGLLQYFALKETFKVTREGNCYKNYDFWNSEFPDQSAQSCTYFLHFGEAVLTSTHNLFFLAEVRKITVYPCKPQFYCIKVGFQRFKII